MKFHRVHGVLPNYLVDSIISRNPELIHFRQSQVETLKLWAARPAASSRFFRFVEQGKSPIEVFDSKGGYSLPGTLVRTEGSQPCGVLDADNCYGWADQFRQFLLEVVGRNGIDGSGMKMSHTVRYNMNNAYWNGRMVFGVGDNVIFVTFATPDIYGHEVGHGETEYHGNGKFVYRNQPGALNEHLSDVRGETFEMWLKKTKVADHDWVVGNGIFVPGINGVGIRHMLLPGTAYNDKKLGKDPQPAKMSDYWKGSGDNGGVHYNSGIPNRAFALFCLDVGGNAWEIPLKIWYAARAAAPDRPSFQQFAQTTIDAASAIGHAKLVDPLKRAWKEVEVEPNMKAVDPDLDEDVEILELV